MLVVCFPCRPFRQSPPGRLFFPYVTILLDGELAVGAAMLFSNGDMVFYGIDNTGADVGLGTWRETSGDRFSFDATLFDLEGGVQYISGSGTYGQDGLYASFSGGGEVAATRLHSFQIDLTYQHLAGTYDIVVPMLGTVGSLNVNSDGSASGSTFDGCSLAGGFVIPDSQFSQAYFEADVTNCADAGTFFGAASYSHDDGAILVFGSDGFYGFIMTLE